MTSSSERSSSLSVSGLWRRPVGSSSPPRPHSGGPPQPDIDPPPRPRPVLQLLAFVLFTLLVCLQFLPATHFRHPFDPLRSWIPFDPHPTTAPPTNSRAPYEEQSSDILKHEEAEKIHIFSWSNCWDLRVLAVLANSTLSSSRFPELVHFHFFLPDGEDENLSYYKLKVLFPHSNIDIIGQKEVKEKLRAATPEGELLWPILHEVIPFIIPHINASWNKFLYVSPDIIMKIADVFTKPQSWATLELSRHKLCLVPTHSLRGDVKDQVNASYNDRVNASRDNRVITDRNLTNLSSANMDII